MEMVACLVTVLESLLVGVRSVPLPRRKPPDRVGNLSGRLSRHLCNANLACHGGGPAHHHRASESPGGAARSIEGWQRAESPASAAAAGNRSAVARGAIDAQGVVAIAKRQSSALARVAPPPAIALDKGRLVAIRDPRRILYRSGPRPSLAHV